MDEKINADVLEKTITTTLELEQNLLFLREKLNKNAKTINKLKTIIKKNNEDHAKVLNDLLTELETLKKITLKYN